MPTVLSKILLKNKRILTYCVSTLFSAIGIAYFKIMVHKRQEISLFSKWRVLLILNTITTEIPLLLSPFACIECIFYLLELLHKYNKITLIYFLSTSLLGVILPIYHIQRNKYLINVNFDFNKDFMKSIKQSLYIPSMLLFGVISIRLILYLMKFIVSGGFGLITIASTLICVYQLAKFITKVGFTPFNPVHFSRFLFAIMVFYAAKYPLGYVGKIYQVLAKLERIIINVMYKSLLPYFSKICKIKRKLTLLIGILLSNGLSLIIHSSLSEYMFPLSYETEKYCLEQDNKWMYESFYYFLGKRNQCLPKAIYLEIFEFAGLEFEYKLIFKNNRNYETQKNEYSMLYVIVSYLACWKIRRNQ